MNSCASWMRAVTSLGNAGQWAMFSAHTVIGKTALPSDVTGANAVQDKGIIVIGCDNVIAAGAFVIVGPG